MYNIKKYIVSLLGVMVLAASCKKDAEVYTLEDGSFPAGSLKASSANVVLTQATENNTAVTFNWSAASFGKEPVVSYTVQVAKASDTAGANAWSAAKNFSVGSTTFSYSFIGKELNDVLTTMGLPSGTANDVAVRIKADVPQADGSASSVKPAHSNVLLIKVTTYSLILYIPGEYQGWNPGTAPELRPVEGHPRKYEAYVYMPGTGVKYFKYTNARNWNNTNYGDGGGNTFSTDGNAGGLNVPTGGYYQVTADFNTNRWSATATTWSIIGDATPGGWNSDTPLTYDPATQTWKATVNMVSNGSFKFRANNAWLLNFGVDGSGKLAYADHPFLGYTAGINNITVPVSGTYVITLDLHLSQQYTYSAVKQ